MPPQQETGLAGTMTCSIPTAAPRAGWSGRSAHRAAARRAALRAATALTDRVRAAAPPTPAEAAALLRRRRVTVTLPAVIVLLAGLNVGLKYGPPHTGLVVGPIATVALLGLARWSGLSWTELGLGRRSVRTGVIYAAGAVAAVSVVYVAGAALPATRGAFLDARYQLAPGAALVTSLIVIPLGTVLLEEIAFRGVLPGLAAQYLGPRGASGLSAALFGLWHILPSLRLGTANKAIGAVAGQGPGAQVLVVSAAVGFTAVAGLVFCELRRRSGSVLASAGLHWATNGLGVLLAALLWRVGTD